MLTVILKGPKVVLFNLVDFLQQGILLYYILPCTAGVIWLCFQLVQFVHQVLMLLYQVVPGCIPCRYPVSLPV